MKLGIGTVQFGMPYGISNAGGVPAPHEIREILRYAAECGVHYLDTAALYGESERALGEAVDPGANFRIVTKTPKAAAAEVTERDAESLREHFQRSLERLRASRVYGLLIHDADDLLKPGGDRLFSAMANLRDQGLVSKIGASVYSGAQIDRLSGLYPLGLVQVPVSVLDQRLLAGGQLRRLKEKGVEIHARSVFLQGLLLMKREELPAHLAAARPWLDRVNALASAAGLTPLEAALQFVLGLPELESVMVGVCSRAQLEELVRAAKKKGPADLRSLAQGCACEDETIVNPARWGVA